MDFKISRRRAWTWTAISVSSFALAACSSSQSAGIPAVSSPNIAATSTLQFAVGTATIALANGLSQVGLNVVATFRQPNGNNATGVNTPTIVGPKGLNFGSLLGNSNQVAGITPAQLSTLLGQIKAQPQANTLSFPLAVAAATGFGPFVGVFGYGLAGDNLLSINDVSGAQQLGLCLGIASAYVGNVSAGSGTANVGSYYGAEPDVGSVPGAYAGKVIPANLVRSAELALPISSGQTSNGCQCPSVCAPFGSPLVDLNYPVQYFGGPPAWPVPQGYGNYSYFVGYPLGFTEFSAAPVAGTYTLSVAFPTSSDFSTYGTLSKVATLPAANINAPLPTLPQPTLIVNADGSGVVTLNVPARVSETVITIVTNDCDLTGRDLASSSGVYVNHYALVTKSTGPQTFLLSALLGPPSTLTGLPTHTFCTVSDVQSLNAYEKANGLAPSSTYNLSSYVSAVGFDYSAYESSYPFNTTAAPPISNGDGHNGQADVTTSYPLTVTTNLVIPAGN